MADQSETLSPGTIVGDYTIERLIGVGGMGAVYVAHDGRLKRRVALKVLVPTLANDASFRERFIRESELAASLDHPNVVPIYDADERDETLYIAMRYVEGNDLGNLIQKAGKLGLEQTAAVVSQVAGALDAAHAAGLVHRDVKPPNILIAQGGHVYLSDFGVAKRTASEGMTRMGLFVGSVDYASPEQLEGRSVDGRSDIYSLGCVAYQCLAGEAPFRRDSEVAVVMAHLKDPPPRLPAGAAPQAVDDVLARALAKQPGNRYPTATELARAFANGAHAPAPPRREPARPRPSFETEDRLGGTVHSLLTSPPLLVGALAGAVATLLPALILLVASLPGVAGVQLALGTREASVEQPSAAVQLVRSFFAPHLVYSIQHRAGSEGATRFLSLPSLLVFALAVSGIGVVVRRRLTSPSTRLAALVACTAASVAVLALLAVTVSYSFHGIDYSYPAGRYVAACALETMVLGFWAFGLASSLPVHIRRPLTAGVLIAVTTFLIAALAFPLLVVAGGARHTEGRARIVRDVAVLSRWSSGVGVSATPLAFAASVRLTLDDAADLPFTEPISGYPHGYTYRPRLAKYMASHTDGRALSYAGTGGLLWRFLVLGASIAALAAWAAAATHVVRRLGVTHSLFGARAGLIMGVAGCVTVDLLVWLGSARFVSVTGAGGGSFGVASSGLVQTNLELLALCGGAGLVAAAIRFAAAEKVEGQEACGRCGTPFGKPTARFCVACGKPRG